MSKVYSVKELVEANVIFPPMDGNHGETHPKGEDFTSDGIPFIMASDIENNTIDFATCKYISEKQALRLRKGHSLLHDVLLTHKATIGRTVINRFADFPFLMLTPQVTYYRIKNHEILNHKYLKYYFDSKYFQSIIQSWADAGSTRAYIGITKQLDLPVYVPDITTQRQVASVLSTLDDKIELNNRINAELEQMAKTLYDYWFVQFEFPNKQGKPYKSSGGKMVYNEVLKREVPEGWEVKSIGDLCFINSNQISNTTNWEFYNYLDTSNLTKNVIDKIVKINNKENLPSRARRIVKENDILYSTVRPNQEHYGILKSVHENMVVSTGFAVLSPKKADGINDILYYFISAKETTDFLQNIAQNSVSAYPSINPDELSSMKLALPKDTGIWKPLVMVLSSINKKVHLNQQQNQQLSSLRDWLLPMLMNGQVSVGYSSTAKAYEQTQEEALRMAAEDGGVYKKKGGRK